tara:strand:+ start:1614 stop:2699 length:1086 start_codon:yes stop_codon:yes gene_type:complete
MKYKKFVITGILIIAIIIAIIVLESMRVKVPQGNNDISSTNLKKGEYPLAPELVGTQKWINSEPLKIQDLKGKVVLIDFWTYTCINCIRTLPYLTAWDEKYKDKGLVIIGVHTPEFQFEKKIENVQQSVTKHNIKYPVVQDNNFATWSAYANRYWPHKYLIDSEGYIRYDHIGEGGYEETESKIKELLGEINSDIDDSTIDVSKINVDHAEIGTPEIYLGYKLHRGNFGNPEGITPNEIVEYIQPSRISPNNVYLDGTWKSNEGNMELVSEDGSILLIYKAKVLNIVAGSEQESELFVSLNNEFLNQSISGDDTKIIDGKSISTIKESKLYNLVDGPDYELKVLSIDIFGPGFKLYTFTFG